jgi:hypothetical protein
VPPPPIDVNQVNPFRVDIKVGANLFQAVQDILLAQRTEIGRPRIGLPLIELIPLSARAVPATLVVAHWRGDDIAIAFGEFNEVVVFHHVVDVAAEPVQRDHQRRRTRGVVLRRHVQPVWHVVLAGA